MSKLCLRCNSSENRFPEGRNVCVPCRNKYQSEARDLRIARKLVEAISIEKTDCDEPTHKTCASCNIEKPRSEFYSYPKNRDGLFGKCKDCQRQRALDNYYANQETRIRQATEWARANPGRRLQIQTDWRLKHRDRINALLREMRPINAPRLAANAKRWALRHPERRAAYNQAYRARRMKAPGKYTAEQIKWLHKLQRGYCAVCRKKLKKYHVDHVIPLAKGGTNYISNIQLLCARCNCRKNDMDPLLFMQRSGYLL